MSIRRNLERGGRRAAKPSSIAPPIAWAHPLLKAGLALGAAAVFVHVPAADRGPAGAPIPHGPDLPGYELLVSFPFYNAPEGHGPLASVAMGLHANDDLIGVNFFGGEAQRRCDCVLGGAIYAMTPGGGGVTTLHAFSGTDGIGPIGQLMRGGDGLWYGLTVGGGLYGHGTAFRLAGDGSRFEVLHSFGATSVDGSLPAPGPLALARDGSFYGATTKGGSAGKGTLFRMTPDGTVTTVHDFTGRTGDGWDPQDQPFVDADGDLYGTTACGGKPQAGAHCGGALYRLTSAGAFSVLHAFETADGGYHPLGSPVRVGQRLYGTTSAGGSGGFGIAYGIDLAGTNFAKLHDFGGGLVASPPNDDGARPAGRLLVATDGLLYGTTSNGGPNHQLFPAGDGTIFRIAPSGAYELLRDLGADGADAIHPVSALVQGRNGFIYGTTDNGGAGDSGAVFRFPPPALPGRGGSRGANPARVRRAPRRVRTTIARLAGACALASAACGAQAQAVPSMVEFSKAWSLIAADFDGDGHEDIFIAGHDQEDRIWYWSPTGYLPGPQTLPWHDRHGCAAADVDRDGRLDIFCAIGAEKGTGKADNELWHQEPNGTFTSVRNFGAEDPYGRGRKPVFLDLDHDGWPDLYVTNDGVERDDRQDNINRMYLNQRNGTFVEIATIATGKPNQPGLPGSECVARGDVDGDGWDDLLVCNHDGPGSIFINNHADDFTLLDTNATRDVWKDAQLVDMNGDGRDDLVVVTRNDHLQIWLNTGQSPWFVTPTLDVLLPAPAAGLTTGNFDGDSRRDVYVVLHGDCAPGELDEPDALFHQRTPRQWTMERLPQSFGGCGYMAATIAGTMVLLANGTTKNGGPNYVLTFGSK
jgi:uncharacterized repeat protein (TIGR03803 family)